MTFFTQQCHFSLALGEETLTGLVLGEETLAGQALGEKTLTGQVLKEGTLIGKGWGVQTLEGQMLGEETLAGQVDMTMMLEKVEVKVVIMIGSPMTMEGGIDDGDDDWDESEEEDGANVGQVNAYNRFRHPELWTSEEIRKLIRINKAEFEGFCAMTTPVTLHSTVLSHPSRAFLFQFRVCQDASKEVLGALYRAVLNLKHF